MKLGKAFPDSVVAEQKAVHRSKKEAPHWWRGAGRALFFATVLVVSLSLLIFRLFTLTIIRGHEFRVLAEGNRTKERILPAPRGVVTDRTGAVLARNLVYPAQEATAHVVGYTGEITPQELADSYYKFRGYRQGERIGRTGVEAVFEQRLRGRNGRQLVEVTAQGEETRALGRVAPVPGEDLSLSVDRALSQAALEAFPKESNGAVVASLPKTGEILVLVSSPSFDSNIFSLPLSPSAYEALFNDARLPLFNRAIGGTYPPGSTFKIVTAIAALEEGAVNPTTLVEDVGVLAVGPFRFPNWYFTKYGKTDGMVDLVKALERSNDIYFYKAGEAVGIGKLAAWAKKIGVGTSLGIQIPGEAGGLMPDPAWKARRFDTQQDRLRRNDQWYLGDTYHVAIGQGYLLTTPLQVNAWTNVIANEGRLCRPTIEKVKSQKSKVKSECKDLGIKKETVEVITEGMKRACEPGGTGWPLFNFQVKSKTGQEQNKPENTFDSLAFDSLALSIPVACKTGTAEFGDPQDRTHAWFTAFAPIEQPEISVTVLVEGAGEGSDKAAPIAKKILEEWFSR